VPSLCETTPSGRRYTFSYISIPGPVIVDKSLLIPNYLSLLTILVKRKEISVCTHLSRLFTTYFCYELDSHVLQLVDQTSRYRFRRLVATAVWEMFAYPVQEDVPTTPSAMLECLVGSHMDQSVLLWWMMGLMALRSSSHYTANPWSKSDIASDNNLKTRLIVHRYFRHPSALTWTLIGNI